MAVEVERTRSTTASRMRKGVAVARPGESEPVRPRHEAGPAGFAEFPQNLRVSGYRALVRWTLGPRPRSCVLWNEPYGGWVDARDVSLGAAGFVLAWLRGASIRAGERRRVWLELVAVVAFGGVESA